jgi:hypothetical protein
MPGWLVPIPSSYSMNCAIALRWSTNDLLACDDELSERMIDGLDHFPLDSSQNAPNVKRHEMQ